MVKAATGLATGIVTVFVSTSAYAQCTNDIDCGTGAICENGTCTPRGSEADGAAVPVENPCAEVTCSGHGACIIKGGEPVCACHDGYRADDAGVNCLPFQGGESSPASDSALTKNDGGLPVQGDDAQGRADYEKVKAALPEFSHESDFLTYGRALKLGRIQGSFIEYKRYRANKRRRGAGALIGVGTFFAAVSLPLFGVGIANLARGDRGWGPPFLGPAGLCLGIAIPLLATGAVRMSRAKRTIRGLATIDTTAASREHKSARVAVAPFFDTTSATWGLGSVYVF
jgi:hypothetical protein